MTDPEFPQPLDLDSLSIVDAPAEHVVPNHHASSDDVPWNLPKDPPWGTENKPKRRTVRERLMGTKSKEDTPVRDVRPSKPRKSVPNKPGQFVEPVENFYNLVAMTLMPFRPQVSMAIMMPTAESTEDGIEAPTTAHNCAVAWDEAAQKSEAVRNFLDSFMTVGVVGKLIAAHLPIAMAAMPNNSKWNPAAAMEEMLRRRAEQQESEQQ